MKLAIIGYGKMGKEIERLAVSRGHSIGATIDNASDWVEKASDLSACDAAIEFSMPSIAAENLGKCFKLKIPVVTGTTGWYEVLPHTIDDCIENDGALFYASNFSIGVNLFFEINKKLAQLMNKQPEYDVRMKETHHIHKLDAPSGTAVTLANDIIGNLDRKTKWVNRESSAPEELEIISSREGEVTGLHKVEWISNFDTISLRHEAFNRQGFALGAVIAAEFLASRKGIYTMKDLFSQME